MHMIKISTFIAGILMAASSLPCAAAAGQPTRIAPPTGKETIVENQPNGELTLYSRTSRGFREFYGIVEQTIDEGSVVKMVEQNNGTVWLHNTVPTFLAPGWVKAEKTDDKLIINGPQLIYEEYDWDADDGSYLKYFLTAVKIEEYENEEGVLMKRYVPTEDGVFSFSINGNTIKEEGDGSLILGIVTYTEKNGYFFIGYGSNYVVLTLPEDKPVEVPQSAEVHEKWAMHYYDFYGYEKAAYVDVAIDDDDYYVKGIYPSIPEAWVKGTLKGSTITFPNFQYIGPDLESNLFVYLAGGQMMESDADGYTMEAIIDPEGFAMTLEDDGTLYADTNIVFATSPQTNPDNANIADYFEGVYIKPQDPSTFTNPVGPDDIYLGGFDGIPAIEFNLPTLDVEGNLLNVDNIYISAYVNSQIFTFTPDDYYDLEDLGIDEPTTELPYNFGNGWDFFQVDTWHTINIYGIPEDTIYNIGIQSIYYPDGKDVNPDNVLKSTIIYVGSPEDPSSVGGIEEAKEIKEVRFFDMQGRQVANPSNGVYVKKTAFTDGSVEASKITVRK